MTDDKKNRLLQLFFTEIRADHVEGRVSLEFKVRPAWEPSVEALLARRRMTEPGLPAVITPERKTGVKHAEVVTARLVQDGRGWLRLAG
jgi:hypothetical protein